MKHVSHQNRKLMWFLVVAALLSFAGCASNPLKTENNGILGDSPPLNGGAEELRAHQFREQGFSYYRKGDFPRAIHSFEVSLLLDPQPSESWFRYILYYCHIATGDYRQALTVAENLVKEKPYESLSYQQVALAQLWLGQANASLATFQRALEFEAHSPRLHFYKGIAHARLKDETQQFKAFKEAEVEYQQILKTNSQDFIASYELASMYLYWNHSLDLAEKLIAGLKDDLAQSVEEELPEERKIYLDYYVPVLEGILLHRKGEHERSLTSLFKSMANSPSGVRADLAEIYFYIGENYSRMGDEVNTKNFYLKALELDPNGAYALALQTNIGKPN